MPLYPKQRDGAKRDRAQRYSYDPSYAQTPRDSYEDLFKQFERLQVKAESLAEKDPIFASRLESLAKQFADGRKVKGHHHQHHHHQQHPQKTYQPPPPPPNFNPFHPPHYYRGGHVPTPPPQQANVPPPPPPQPPQPPPGTPPPQQQYFTDSQSFHNGIPNGFKPSSNFKSGYQHHRRHHPHRHKRYFANQPDVLFVMEDAYDPNKITVQMTRIQLGPNGEQQRVIIERDFYSENELNVFLAEFEENITKVTEKEREKEKEKYSKNKSEENLTKSPGVIVVEEPGEEPRLYRQDTGELVTDGDGVFRGSANRESNAKKATTKTTEEHDKKKASQSPLHSSNRKNEETPRKPSNTEHHHHNRQDNHHRRTNGQSKPRSKHGSEDNISKSTQQKPSSKRNDSKSKDNSKKDDSKKDDSKDRTKKSYSSADDGIKKDKHKSRSRNYSAHRTNSSAESRSRNKKKVETSTATVAPPPPVITKSRKNNNEEKKKSSSSSSSTSSSSNSSSSSSSSNSSNKSDGLPTHFTSGVGYRQQRFMPNIAKSNPNIFMSHHPQPPPPPLPPQMQVPPMHLFNNQPLPPGSVGGYHRTPAYGKINLLRYGYTANAKPRSESHIFSEKAAADELLKAAKINDEAANNKKSKKKLKKFKIPPLQHSIYSAHHLNNQFKRNNLFSNSKYMHATEILKENSRIVSLSVSSTKLFSNKFPFKPKGVTKLYKEHSRVHFDTLRGCKNAANVLKPEKNNLYDKHLNFVKKQKSFNNFQPPSTNNAAAGLVKDDTYLIINDILQNYETYLQQPASPPTYFQPGFYPANSYPDLNNLKFKSQKFNLFF